MIVNDLLEFLEVHDGDTPVIVTIGSRRYTIEHGTCLDDGTAEGFTGLTLKAVPTLETLEDLLVLHRCGYERADLDEMLGYLKGDQTSAEWDRLSEWSQAALKLLGFAL